MHYTQAYTVSLRVITLPVVEIQETMTAHALFSLQDVRLISGKAEVSSLRTCFYTSLLHIVALKRIRTVGSVDFQTKAALIPALT